MHSTWVGTLKGGITRISDEFSDELTGFEEAWKGNARKKMPRLPENYFSHEHMGNWLA